jgi:chemotaxis protein MotB
LRRDDLSKLKDEIEKAMKQTPQLNALQDHVQMTVTGEGLRVELLETEKGLFFQSGDPQPSSPGEQMLLMLARQLGQLPNNILIEGHTDSKPYGSADGYTNWELSVDRANAARRLMEASGLRPGQVTQVRGFADRRLRKVDDPNDASNRRISVIVQYMDAQPGEQVASSNPVKEPAKTAAGGHH